MADSSAAFCRRPLDDSLGALAIAIRLSADTLVQLDEIVPGSGGAAADAYAHPVVRGEGERAVPSRTCGGAAQMSSTCVTLTTRAPSAIAHDRAVGPLYGVHPSSDGCSVLFGAVELKFFERFRAGVGRPDLVDHHFCDDIEFGFGDDELHRQLKPVFASATRQQRFVDWDVPGSTVLQSPDSTTSPPVASWSASAGSGPT